MSESEIGAALARLTDAWNRGDAAAYAKLFTSDAQYIAFNGQRAADRESIEETHRWLFQGPLAGTRLGGRSPAQPEIRWLRPDVALITTYGGMTLSGQDAPDPAHESVITLVAVRGDQGWRFASFQNTRKDAR